MRKLLVAIWMSAVVVMGCSDDGANPPGGNSSSAAANGSGGDGASGGNGATGGGGATGGPGGADGCGQGAGAGVGANATALEGSVQVVSHGSPLPAQSTAIAHFFEQPPSATCRLLTSCGPCVARVCDLGGSGGQQADAGTVTVTGDVGTATLLWDAGSYSVESSDTEGLYTAGATVAFAATGSAEVPAFSGQVLAPAQVEVTAPAFEAPMVVDRSEDMTFTWTGGTTGFVWIGIGGVIEITDDELVEVICRVPAADGSIAVPAAALANLPATDLGVVGTRVEDEQVVTAGDWTVRLRAIVPATAAGAPKGLAQADVGAVVIQ